MIYIKLLRHCQTQYHWNGNAYSCISELAIATISVELIYRLKHFPTIILFKTILAFYNKYYNMCLLDSDDINSKFIWGTETGSEVCLKEESV